MLLHPGGAGTYTGDIDQFQWGGGKSHIGMKLISNAEGRIHDCQPDFYNWCDYYYCNLNTTANHLLNWIFFLCVAGNREDTEEDANFSYSCVCLLSHETSRGVMGLGGSPRDRRGRLERPKAKQGSFYMHDFHRGGCSVFLNSANTFTALKVTVLHRT